MGDVNSPPVYAQDFMSISKAHVSSYTLSQTRCNQSGISVSIISHSHLLREALILLLKNHWPIDVTHRHPDNSTSIAPVVKSLNHLVLLDSNIGHDSVLAHIRAKRGLKQAPYIIVLELKDDPELILDCIEAGAHAYVLQGASSADVIQVIKQVYRGAAQCSPEITAKLFDRLTRSKAIQPSSKQPTLTRRELEVLHYIAQDYSDRSIATALIIEVRTVKHHVHNILRKLNVKHRRDAAQLAVNQGWLDRATSP